MGEKLLTIVVPAYNVERYLEDCIDSLLKQSVCDHDIIIVNDGSTDGTPEICEKYALQYPDTITYISQKNQGLGAARNTGFMHVETPFVTFLDSDDWMGHLFVEKFKKTIESFDHYPDMVVTLPWMYDTATNQYLAWHSKEMFDKLFTHENSDLVSPVYNTKSNPELLALEISANSKVYKTEMLKRINFSFPVGVRWEDIRAHFQLLHEAKEVAGVDAGFYYRLNTGSQITAENGKSRLDAITVFQDTLDYVNSHNFTDDEYSYFLRWFCNYTKWNLDMVSAEYREPLLEGFHKLYREIPMYRFQKYLNTCSPKRRKEMAMITIFKSPFYKSLKDYWVKEKVVEKLERIIKK